MISECETSYIIGCQRATKEHGCGRNWFLGCWVLSIIWDSSSAWKIFRRHFAVHLQSQQSLISQKSKKYISILLRAILRCSLVALLKIMKHKKYFRLLAVPGERIWYSFYDLMASDYHPKGMRIFPQINKFPSHELLSHPLVAFSSLPWNSCRRLHTMSVTGVYDKS